MITVVIPAQEAFNNETQEFIKLEKSQKLELEHSLISVSKWESKWKKPFITANSNRPEHTREESLDYIRCMTINKNVDPLVYTLIPNRMIDAINNYIDDPRSATKFYSSRHDSNSKKQTKKELTSEYIYAKMAQYGIPFDVCEKWHLNRLLTLLRICATESKDAEKMTMNDRYAQHRALNARRRARTGSRG